MLLGAGADPNAGYLWEGLVPPFTALTGVFGSGEGGQPPHPQWPTLARMLLSAGADPNDSQTIYNWGLGGLNGDDTAVLELLIEFGFGRGDGGPWRRLGDAYPTPAQMMAEELAPPPAACPVAPGCSSHPAPTPTVAVSTPRSATVRRTRTRSPMDTPTWPGCSLPPVPTPAASIR